MTRIAGPRTILSRRTLPSVLAVATLAVTSPLGVTEPGPAVALAQAHPAGAGASRTPGSGAIQLRETVTRDGPLALGDQQYTVVSHYAVLSAKTTPPAKAASTLSSLEILDAHGASLYQQTFPYTVNGPRFQEKLTASASLLTGDGGVALVVRFLEQSGDPSDDAHNFAKESWQLFDVVDGQFASLGAVLPLGHGSDITVNGTLAAVMMKNGIAVMPMASTAEVLGFRAWTGSFYASVPMRFDWAHGQWGEGQQCYQTTNGTATERGCIMSLGAPPRPQRSPDADTRVVRLFVAPDGNTENLQNLPVSPESRIEFLEMQALVRWHTEGSQGQRVACTFSNVWLRVQIDGKEGWVQGQDDLDALGLPLASPQ